MVIVIALMIIGLAGLAAYAFLRASEIPTGGEERLAIVIGFAFALVLRPESPAELIAELVAISLIVLAIASIAHLLTVTLRGSRATTATG
jgi:hypothetical protein